jgi:predicted transcriptional regulator
MAQVRSLLRGVPVRAAMMTRFRVLAEDDCLSTVTGELLAGSQQDFPVVSSEQILGVLTRKDVIAALAEGRPDVRVGDVMRRELRLVEESEMLEDIYLRMKEGDCSALPVTREGQLVGMITLENVGEWLMIQSALGRRSVVPASTVSHRA